ARAPGAESRCALASATTSSTRKNSLENERRIAFIMALIIDDSATRDSRPMVRAWRLGVRMRASGNASMESPAMKPYITLITLGVDDLERALAFYRDGLGLPTEGIVGQELEHGAVAFFTLRGGVRLALWPRSSIAWDAGVAQSPPSPTEFTLAHNVSSREEVDE